MFQFVVSFQGAGSGSGSVYNTRIRIQESQKYMDPTGSGSGTLKKGLDHTLLSYMGLNEPKKNHFTLLSFLTFARQPPVEESVSWSYFLPRPYALDYSCFSSNCLTTTSTVVSSLTSFSSVWTWCQVDFEQILKTLYTMSSMEDICLFA